MIVSSIDNIIEIVRGLKSDGKTIVFTNGCFDIIHRGHVDYLRKAKALGDILIVGLNSDSSVRRIKGENRPIVPEGDRAAVLSELRSVDFVVPFEEDTPEILIEKIAPDILVKGSDWQKADIVGADFVERHGGKVATIKLTEGRGTSQIIERILKIYGGNNFGK